MQIKLPVLLIHKTTKNETTETNFLIYTTY